MLYNLFEIINLCVMPQTIFLTVKIFYVSEVCHLYLKLGKGIVGRLNTLISRLQYIIYKSLNINNIYVKTII